MNRITSRFVSTLGLASLVGMLISLSTAPFARAAVIADWKFEPGAALTVDSSGNGHTLTNNNVTSGAAAPSDPGSTGSASFNGTSGYFVSDLLPLNGQTALTVEWFMKANTSTGVQLPFEQTGNANLNNSRPTAQQGAFVSVLDNGTVDARLDLVHFTASSNDHEHFTDTSLTSWTHYAMVMQQVASPGAAGATALKLELYIDGVLQSASTTDGQSGQQTKFADAELYIGARGDGNGDGTANDPSLFYNGLLDELRISTGALTPDQFLIPEPASISLLAGAALLMPRRRRRLEA